MQTSDDNTFFGLFKMIAGDIWRFYLKDLFGLLKPNPLAGLSQERINFIRSMAKGGAAGGNCGRIIIPDAKGMAELRAGKTIEELIKNGPKSTT